MHLLLDTECQEPLGMEKGGISDDQITASTELNNHHAIQGRLHFPESSLAGGWVAAVSDENQWLQIDLGNRFANVTGVATQGRDHHNQWVTTYNLHYGDDGASFTYYNVRGETVLLYCRKRNIGLLLILMLLLLLSLISRTSYNFVIDLGMVSKYVQTLA